MKVIFLGLILYQNCLPGRQTVLTDFKVIICVYNFIVNGKVIVDNVDKNTSNINSLHCNTIYMLQCEQRQCEFLELVFIAQRYSFETLGYFLLLILFSFLGWIPYNCSTCIGFGNILQLSFEPLIILLNNPILFFSYLSTEDLESRALKLMQDSRSKPAVVGFLVPDPGQDKREWGEKKKVNKKSLVHKTIAAKVNQYSATRDQVTLRKFLYRCEKDKLCYPNQLKLKDIMPLEVPLLDLLSVDSQRSDAYKVPSLDEIKLFQKNRGLDFLSHKPVSLVEPLLVKELVVGVSTDEEILEIWQWCDKQRKIDEEIYPAGVISLDVEEIKIRNSDKNLILHSIGSPDPVTTGDQLAPNDKWYQWPAKILIGNGLRYMIIITWPAEQVKIGVDIYRIWPHKPQDLLIDYLASLPTAVGVGIKNDTTGLSRHFSEFNPSHKLEMEPWMDLTTLVALCGYRLQATNMAALSMGILGGLLDKISSRADGLWCVPWDKLPQEFKIYAIGDVKFGHMAFIVLSSILIRDVFPDPESLCYVADTSQHSMVKKVCKWIRESLSETELWFDPRALPTDRKELIDCIRERHETASGKLVFSYTPPRRVSRWADLLGDWPTLSDGGPRYLHQVRNHLVKQFQVIIKEDFNGLGFGCFKSSGGELTPSAVRYLTFQQPNIPTCDHGKPVPMGELGLFPSPGLAKPLFKIEPSILKVGELIKTSKSQGRSQRDGLYEFARLNPREIPKIYLRLEKTGDITKEFWLQHDSLYEDLRLMNYRLTNVKLKPLEWIENRILSRMNNVFNEEKALRKKAKMELERRDMRFKILRTAIKAGDSIRRTGIINYIPEGMGKLKVKRSKISVPVRKKSTNVPFPKMRPLSEKGRKLVSYSKSKLFGKKSLVRVPADEPGEKDIVIVESDYDLNTSNDSQSCSSSQHIVECEEHELSTDAVQLEPVPSTSGAFVPMSMRKRKISEGEIFTPLRPLPPHLFWSSREEPRTSTPDRRVRFIPAGAEGDSDIDPGSNSLDDDPSSHPNWMYF